MKGRVLVIAGSDSGGGAGIQADIKTVTALGGFAATAITALTAQNTLGVQAVMPVPPDFIQRQIRAVLDDIGADAIKIGMLGGTDAIAAVLEVLSRHAAGIPIVLDPVMIAKGGHALLENRAVATLRDRLLPAAALITPNIPEAEALTGNTIRSVEDMLAAAEALIGMGAKAVLLKGGHLEAETLTDLLVTRERQRAFSDQRIRTRHTHGTGCTIASAVAAGLAQGMDLPQAVMRARNYVRAAIAAAPGYGGGHGPLNHAVTVDPTRLGGPGT